MQLYLLLTSGAYLILVCLRVCDQGKFQAKTASGFRMLPSMIYFFEKFVLSQKQWKYAMNAGVVKIRGALSQFLQGKSALLYLCRTLPSHSKITPDLTVHNAQSYLALYLRTNRMLPLVVLNFPQLILVCFSVSCCYQLFSVLLS